MTGNDVRSRNSQACQMTELFNATVSNATDIIAGDDGASYRIEAVE